MKQIDPYLIFDGNCREAMTFYKKCLGGNLEVMPFSEAPEKFGFTDFPEAAKSRIMHACLTNGSVMLMASDNMPGMTFQQGNNFSVSISAESLEESEKLFAGLSAQGTVTAPLRDAFWGARFGMLTDQFGINWMISFEKPK